MSLRPQLRIVFVYVIVASLWILFSDALLLSLGVGEALLARLSTAKGLAFVAVTGGVLYFHLQYEFGLRYHLESDLVKSEARFRVAIQEAPLPVVIFDESGQILTVNRAWQEISGYSAADLPTIDVWTRLAYGSQRQTVREGIDLLFDQGKRVDEGEFTITCRDGSERVWAFSSTPLGYLGDSRRVVISMAMDVTDTVEVRSRLADELNRSQRMLDAMFNGYLLGDTNGRILDVNQQYCDMLGYERDQLTGKSLFDIDVTTPEQTMVENAKTISHDGIVMIVETQHRHSSGHPIDVEISSVELKPGQIACFIRDITERKQMLNQLRESEQRFRQLAENINEVFYLSDSDKRQMLYVSPAYEVIWGKSREHLYRDYSSFMDDIHPDDRDAVQLSFDQQRRGEATEVMYRIVRPDGGLRWIRSQAFPVMDANGTLYRIAGLAEDVTEKVKYESQLKRLAQRLVNSLDDERMRIARELHDQIGQQLTVLGINMGIAQMQCSEGHPARTILADSAELISHAIDRMRVIISDLRPLILDDMGLVAGLRWYCEKFTRRTGIPVRLDSSLENASVSPRIDNTLYQIAQEALTNVAKHAQASEVVISLRVDQKQLIMQVQDNGRGFDVRTLTDGEYAGSWGLQIMQERIQALVGARLRIESQRQQGTRITVEVQL